MNVMIPDLSAQGQVERVRTRLFHTIPQLTAEVNKGQEQLTLLRSGLAELLRHCSGDTLIFRLIPLASINLRNVKPMIEVLLYCASVGLLWEKLYNGVVFTSLVDKKIILFLAL